MRRSEPLTIAQSPALAGAAADPALQEEVGRRMFERYVALVRQTGVGANLGTVGFFGAFYIHLRDPLVLVCLAAILLTGAVWSTSGHWPFLRASGRNQKSIERWTLAFAGACGLAYGSSIFVMFVPGRLLANSILILGYLTAIGVTAGGNFWLKRPTFAVCGLIGGLVALRLAMEPSLAYRYMAAGVVFYTAMQLTFAMQAHRMQAESIRQVILNEQLAARLDEATRRAEEASLAKSRFLAAASHDLRQPLHALCLLTDAMRRTSLPAEGSGDFGRLADSVSEMADAVNAILDISRMDAGDMKPSMEPLRIADLVSVLHRHHHASAEHKGLALRFFHRDQVVMADRRMMGRLLGNLLDNAIKHTGSGGVIFAARTLWSSPGEILLEVRDSGVGIESSLQQQVFEEFFQVANPGRDRVHGVGLGLSIVQRLAAAMGMTVGVRSAPGRGSTFWVRCRAAGQHAPRDESPLEAVSSDRGALLGNRRILLVDNETAILHAYSSVLAPLGATVLVASTAAEALALAPSAAPDIAVLDWRLGGGMSGLELATRLREAHGETLPVLIVTGDAAVANDAGPALARIQVLLKPITGSQLVSAIVEELARPAASVH